MLLLTHFQRVVCASVSYVNEALSIHLQSIWEKLHYSSTHHHTPDKSNLAGHLHDTRKPLSVNTRLEAGFLMTYFWTWDQINVVTQHKACHSNDSDLMDPVRNEYGSALHTAIRISTSFSCAKSLSVMYIICCKISLAALTFPHVHKVVHVYFSAWTATIPTYVSLMVSFCLCRLMLG